MMFAPLQHRDFRLLVLGQSISFFGTNLYQIALPWIVLTLTASPVQVGVVVALQAGTQAVLILIGGAVVDRLSRRRVVLGSDALSAVGMLLLAFLAGTAQLRIEHLYVGAVVFGAISAFFTPALQALIPELVPQDVLIPGNAVRGLLRNLAKLTGPLVGGLLVAEAGASWALAVNGVTYLASFAALVLTRPTAVHGQSRTSMLADVGEGLRYTLSKTWLWLLIGAGMIFNIAWLGVTGVALPVLIRDVLGGGAQEFGLVVAGAAVGELAAGLLMTRVRVTRTGIALIVSALVATSAFALYGLVPALPATITASALVGAGTTAFGILWESTLQSQVPARLLGRVVSVDWFGSFLFAPIAPVVAGLLVIALSPTGYMIAAGAFSSLLALTLLSRSVRELR